jgi:hypothetical protein
VVLRDRSRLPTTSRKLEFVADEEIALAIKKALAAAYGMEAAQIPSAACRLLGFTAVNEERRKRIERVIQVLLASKHLVEQGGHLHISAGVNPQQI